MRLSIFWVAAVWSVEAMAQPIVVGPYTFSDERLFAQTATFTAYPGWDPQSQVRVLPVATGTTPTTLAEAVTGFSPNTCLLNVGNPGCTIPCSPGCPPPELAEVVELGFHPQFLPFDAAGPDLILFDARYSDDNYAVSVRPIGGSFTPHHLYLINDQVPTGLPGCGPVVSPTPTVQIWAVEVFFEDFGLAPGTEVDAVRVIGDCQIDPWVEFDLTMVAAVDRTCQLDTDCDDGQPCTSDACTMGTCSFTPFPRNTPCPGGHCDGAPRPRCVECLEHVDCSTDEPCMVPQCEDGSCSYTTTATAGTPCGGGVCSGESEPRCVECVNDEQCHTDHPCRIAVCDADRWTCLTVLDPQCQQDGGTDAAQPRPVDATTIEGDASIEADATTGAGGADSNAGPPAIASDGCGCTAERGRSSEVSVFFVVAVVVLRSSARRRRARAR